MSTKLEFSTIMSIHNAQMIWCSEKEPNTYCYARKKFSIEHTPAKATLSLFVDSRYNVWINGHYVGQGPTPFRKPHVYFDSYDITGLLQSGENVIAILGNYHGVAHCTYTIGSPGIMAQIEVYDSLANSCSIYTDQQWKAFAPGAFARDVPRRNGATAWMEFFDAGNEPTGWQELNYDDSHWPNAQVIVGESLRLMPRIVPSLAEYSVSSDKVVGFWNAPTMFLLWKT